MVRPAGDLEPATVGAYLNFTPGAIERRGIGRWMTQSLVPALIVTTMVLAVAAEAQQPRRSPLFSTVGTGEYLGETYVRRGPRGLFVFFVGEPVKIRITVATVPRRQSASPELHRIRC